MSVEDTEDWADYESGPFCRHYGDPSDCSEKCAVCGHECHEHHLSCDHEGCACPAWYAEAPSEPLVQEAARALTLPQEDLPLDLLDTIREDEKP